MKFFWMSMVLCAAVWAQAEQWLYRWPGMTPVAQECVYEKNVRVVVKDGTRFTVACADKTDMAKWVADKCQAWFKVKVLAKDAATDEKFPNAGGYSLAAKDGMVAITAATAEGVRHAMATLRQLARPASGTLTVGEWELPRLSIRDWPKKELRGIHLCAFPEIPLTKIEHFIRMAAYYKLNFVVLDTWGTYRSEKYPWYGFREGKLTVSECRRLAAIARDLGVTLVPQINFFGHANAARQVAGKGAVLYHAPEYAPLFEPGDGWSWCLANPETRKVQEGLIEEIHAAFGKPGWVHLGGEPCEPSCAVCNAADYPKVVREHLAALCAKATAVGAKPLIWGSMLNAKGLLDAKALPQALVLCSDEGFRKAGMTGTISTPWHKFSGNIFVNPAVWGWGEQNDGKRPKVGGHGSFAYHLRQTANDTPNGADFDNQGWYTDQVRSESPRN